MGSLAHPGGNITGLSLVNPDLIGKQLQLVREALPAVTRLAVLWNPANRLHELSIKEIEALAPALRLQPHLVPARSASELPAAFAAMTAARSQALLVVSDGVFFQGRTQLVELAAKQRLPAMYPWREAAEAGGLVAFGAHVADSFRRAAAYVDKILKGASPAELPVEQPTRFEMVINVKTAKALGIPISAPVLLQADELIE